MIPDLITKGSYVHIGVLKLSSEVRVKPSHSLFFIFPCLNCADLILLSYSVDWVVPVFITLWMIPETSETGTNPMDPRSSYVDRNGESLSISDFQVIGVCPPSYSVPSL